MSLDASPKLDRLREAVARRPGVDPAAVRGVRSPYRVCPIGAHVDHQWGPVLGMAIGLGTELAFAPSPDATCRLGSGNFEGEVAFPVDRPGAPGEGWGRYPRAAAWALADRLPARPRGIVAALHGALPGGGLSSSASLLLACLVAFCEANEIEVTPDALVRLSHRAENGYVGLKSGVLDPAAIVAARRGCLSVIDTRQVAWEAVPPGAGAPDWRVVVAFSGRTRNLTGTGFNRRVDECRAAARELARRAGLPEAERLGELPEAVFEAHLAALPPTEQRRARHFHEERARVRAGVACWREGDLAGFGRAMTDSCRSSIENFETGSPELVALHRALQEGGAFGSRFSGAGFAGCAVGLVAAERAEACRAHVREAYARTQPERAREAAVFVSGSEDGVHIV